MARVASLLVRVGVSLEGALKVESKLRGLKRTTKQLANESRSAFGLFAKGFRKAGNAVGTKITSLVQSFGGLHKAGPAAVAAIGAAATAAAVAIFRFTDSTSAAIDNTNKMAAALGIGVEEMQRLDFVAQQSGVSAAGLQKAIKKLNDRVLELSKGAATRSTEAFKELGIAFEDLEGKTSTEQLGVIADALNNVEDASRRSALSALLLGRNAGPELQTLLASGSKGINQLADQARVLTQEQADAASAFQDRMGEVRNEIGHLVDTLAVELIPVVEKVVVAVRDWLGENEAIIKQRFHQTVQLISDAMGTLADAASDTATVMEGLGNVLGIVGINAEKSAGGVNVLKTALGALFGNIGQNLDNLNKLADLMILMGLASPGADGKFEKLDPKKLAASFEEARKVIKQAGTDQFFKPKGVAAGAAGAKIGAVAGRVRQRSGGRGSPASKALAKADKPIPGITGNELIERLLQGEPEALRERLRGLGASTPDVKDVKPTVAISFFQIAITNHIQSVDPKAAGKEVASSVRDLLRQQNARAGEAFANNIVV